jgi:uncharacterized protein YndB with AHSA1/START domain
VATIQKEIHINAEPDEVWDALRDWGALHTRLVPGFVLDLELDHGDRVIKFFTGTVVRERLIGLDEDERRLAWSIVDGPYAHHNASAQVFDAADGGTRFVWTADVLPHDVAPRTSELMDRGMNTIKQTLEPAASARVPSGH